MNKEMLSVKEAAQVLGVCRMTIYRMVKANSIPYTRIGRSIKIPVSYIEGISKNPINDTQRFIFG
ncbi:MAG: binding domain protein excisionase family [Clostridia bacterium]|jgi:excisionase family DNA binding protein|nr:binding domain protein excisionase family [Clostridia bacterium]